MDKPVRAWEFVSACTSAWIKWYMSDLPGRRLTPLKREWGSRTVKYKVSYKASRTPPFTALINRQTWSQLDATSPVVSGLGELGGWGVGMGCSGSGFTLQVFKRAWHHLKISREQTDCGDCGYKEKNTGHILIWLNLIRPWRSRLFDFMRRCVRTKANTLKHTRKERRKLEGDMSVGSKWKVPVLTLREFIIWAWQMT